MIMGLKRVTKKFLKYLLPTLLVLCVIPFSDRGRHSGEPEDIFPEGKIRFALKLDEKLADGYLTGFCYEMAGLLATHLKDTAEIFLADGVYLDSLMTGNIDILALTEASLTDSKEFMAFPLGDTKAVWLIRSDKRKQKEIIRWLNSFKGTDEYSKVIARFFHGYNPYRKGIRKDPDIISPYDDLIKGNARRIGWDWRMFAALVWSESRFRIQAQSSRGALGLMQMMPKTADRYEIENLLDPKENIEAGAAYIERLQGKFKDIAADDDELVKFTLAAYNAGEGKIQDVVQLARSLGIDHGHWESVHSIGADAIQGSAPNPKQLKLIRNETTAYVKAVLNQYDVFCGNPPRFRAQPSDTSLTGILKTEDEEQILLSSDSLGRIDLGDEQARDQEEDHDDEPGKGVSGKHRR